MSNCFSSCVKGCSRKPAPATDLSYLYAFDFDQTLIDEDSEVAFQEVLGEPVPDAIIDLYNGENWTELCQAMIDYTLKKGVTVDEIIGAIKRLQELPGMGDLLQKIQRTRLLNPKTHLIITSGSNDYFISEYLGGMSPPVTPNAIISNRASRTDEEPAGIRFAPFENQHTCSICPHFLCKGKALQSYIDLHGPFKQVYYCGDGQNDICPAQRLNPHDVLFVRRGYELDNAIAFGYYGGRPIYIRAKVVYFKNAKTIQTPMSCFRGCRGKKDKKFLYVFDFDRTLIDDNSEDVYKYFLTQETTQALLANDEVAHSWPLFCQSILEQIIRKQGVNVDTILRKLGQIPFVPGMDKLLQKIGDSTKAPKEKKKAQKRERLKIGSRLVILSGSNDLFIQSRLMSLVPPVSPDRIFANHLRASRDRRSLTYTPYHLNTECRLCSPVLCKGRVLEEYLKSAGPFDTIYYVGDGGNDVCAAQRLRLNDILFVRTGYQLEECIKSGMFRDVPIFINAQIVYFTDSAAIEANMEIVFQKKSCFGL